MPLAVVAKRMGKRLFYIPILVYYKTQYFRALRFLKHLLRRKRYTKKFLLIFLDEQLTVTRQKLKSLVFKKKNYYYELAFENRMYTHYRWH